MILRLPLKLNARIRGGTPGALAPHANPLLDWSVRAFEAGRNEYVLLSNTRSLYSAVLEGVGPDAARFAERAVGGLRAILEGAGHGPLAGNTGELAPESVRFAKALDRSVTGSMNELVAYATMLLAGGDLSDPEIGVRLNDLLLSALADGAEKYGTPRDALAAMLSRADDHGCVRGMIPGVPTGTRAADDLIPPRTVGVGVKVRRGPRPAG